MKKLALVLALILIASISAAAQQLYGAEKGWITLPEVTTPDGVKLAAGKYLVTFQRMGLYPVNQDWASLGFWPGPTMQLSRIPAKGEIGDPPSYTMKTAFEVKVIYDIPGYWAEKKHAELAGAEWAPYIRNKVLTGVAFRGDIYYIRQTSSLLRFKQTFKQLRPLNPR